MANTTFVDKIGVLTAMPISESPDTALVRRAQSGEGRAYDVLVERYHERIYATIYHMTGNREDAFDLAQEVFIRAYRKLLLFRGQSSFYTWAYRIAVNLTLNFLKKRNRTSLLSLDELDGAIVGDEYFQQLTSHETPRRAANLSELGQQLNSALQKLSNPHRLVVTMHDIQGVPHSEIAKTMQCSMGTVRSRLFYARKQLQGLLGGLLQK
jgi:RNA polymerase sigma-70 factor (ECF subfamily)